MFSLIRKTVASFSADNCPRIAAALAYYTAFSLAPMLVLILSICQLIFAPQNVRGRVESEIAHVVGPAGADQIRTMLETDREGRRHGVIATLVSIGIMTVGATSLFAQLQGAMNDVWQVRPDPEEGGLRNFLAKRLVSLGMVLTVAFLLMISITASATLEAFDDSLNRWLPGQSASALIRLADYAVSCAIITLLFAAMFKFLPDAQIDWTDVWLGAIATSLLFILGKFAIAFYVGQQSTASSYGAAGSLILILMWVYYSALIFLFGAEFTQVWARQRGRAIRPAEGALRVVRRTESIPASQNNTAG